MRTLCLNLNKTERPCIAENFLNFSPKVHFREPNWVFAEISHTAHLFGGEQNLINEVLELSYEFFPEATAAISETPAAAQALCVERQRHISPPTQEVDDLNALPLTALNFLEGLIAWRSTKEIDDVVQFFHLMGLLQLGDLQRFRIEDFRERWGETGALIWRRLHGQDKQVISPLVANEPLTEYMYLDFPVSLNSFLLRCLEKSLKRLFLRLQGRGEFAQKAVIHLHCEYSNHVHQISIEAARPSRDQELFMKLIENKLMQTVLENPIREIEVHMQSTPERIQQLNFWEPQTADQNKLDGLISLLNQAQLSSGFFHQKNDIWPERSWDITPAYEEFDIIDDEVEIDAEAYQIKPSYSKNFGLSPRPSRLLETPRPLSDKEVRRLTFLSHYPIERLEDHWWQDSRGRDYFFALSSQQQSLWIYFDRVEQTYYLHGYFD